MIAACFGTHSMGQTFISIKMTIMTHHTAFILLCQPVAGGIMPKPCPSRELDPYVQHERPTTGIKLTELTFFCPGDRSWLSIFSSSFFKLFALFFYYIYRGPPSAYLIGHSLSSIFILCSAISSKVQLAFFFASHPLVHFIVSYNIRFLSSFFFFFFSSLHLFIFLTQSQPVNNWSIRASTLFFFSLPLCTKLSSLLFFSVFFTIFFFSIA